MISDLHADHVDTSGAYWPKYLVIKELFDKGMLNDLPDEYKPKTNTTQTHTEQQTHTTLAPDTGMPTITNVEEASNSWKSFLKQIIAEEKSKLNI